MPWRCTRPDCGRARRCPAVSNPRPASRRLFGNKSIWYIFLPGRWRFRLLMLWLAAAGLALFWLPIVLRPLCWGPVVASLLVALTWHLRLAWPRVAARATPTSHHKSASTLHRAGAVAGAVL